MMQHLRTAFTLIELLVVITIIVLLLSLLAPAMDQAIYQAELAVCGTQQHGIAAGAMSYAFSSKQFYPNPPGGRVTSYAPDSLGLDSFPQYDVRQSIKGYIENKLLLCPLTQAISLEPQDNLDNTIMYCNYNLWFAWKYEINGPHRGMFKVGQRVEYTAPGDSTPRSLRVLTSDLNIVDEQQPSAQSSHPDKEGILSQQVFHDENSSGVPVAAGDTTLTNGTNASFSRWVTIGTQRGFIDMNVAYDDLSVARFVDVHPVDKRLVPTPTNKHSDPATKLYNPER